LPAGPAAHARRDLDVLDQLGEHLAALGVDDGLLVLGGRPFGVARHASLYSHWLASRRVHQVHEQPVDRGRRHLGVERRRHQRALPDRDDPTRGRPPRTSASTSTPAAIFSTHGARMKIA
jgi:hypothetical protein